MERVKVGDTKLSKPAPGISPGHTKYESLLQKGFLLRAPGKTQQFTAVSHSSSTHSSTALTTRMQKDRLGGGVGSQTCPTPVFRSQGGIQDPEQVRGWPIALLSCTYGDLLPCIPFPSLLFQSDSSPREARAWLW